MAGAGAAVVTGCGDSPFLHFRTRAGKSWYGVACYKSCDCHPWMGHNGRWACAVRFQDMELGWVPFCLTVGIGFIRLTYQTKQSVVFFLVIGYFLYMTIGVLCYEGSYPLAATTHHLRLIYLKDRLGIRREEKNQSRQT